MHCGKGLQPAEEPSLANLQTAILELRSEVRQIRETLSNLGVNLPSVQGQDPPRVERRSPPVRTSPQTAAGEPTPSTQPSAERSESAAPTSPRRFQRDDTLDFKAEESAAPTPSGRFEVDWELILGGNWLARVGVLAVVIGVGFFLKLAFDNNWIGETGRVALGIAGGLGLTGAGEYWSKRYPIYSQALAGGGVAILYLSIFAAFAFYGFIGTYPTVGLLLVVSIGAAVQALRYNSMALAVIGIVGAFLAPFVIGGSGDGAREELSGVAGVEVMVYVLIVDIGVLALSTVRNWRWFTLLALVASLVSFGVWYDYEGDRLGVGAAQGILTAIFLIFVGATTLFHILWQRAPRAFDQALMVLNATAYFGISYGLLWDEFRPWMGAFTVALALFYGLLGYLAVRRGKGQFYLSLNALVIALVFLTTAVPVQLGGPWVSVAWSVEGLILVWMSFRLEGWQMRVSGAGVFALGAIWFLAVDTPKALSLKLTPFLNGHMVSYAIVIAAIYLAAYLVHRNRHSLGERERAMFPALLTAGNLFLAVLWPVQLEGAWISVAWAIQAVVLIWLSYRLDLYEMRLFGLALLAALAAWLLFRETRVNVYAYTFKVVLNDRMLAFAAGIAAFYLAAIVVRRGQRHSDDEEIKYAVPALVVGANALTLWVLSAEVIAVVDSGTLEVSDDAAFYAKSLALSLVWAVYASVGLALGVLMRRPELRSASLGLLAVPVVKLFLFDSFALDQGYRVAAFLSLGGIMLAGGFLYQRYREAIRGFLLE